MAADESQSTLIEVLIAELHEAGVLGGSNLQNMARRLREAGFPEEADGVLFIPFANAMDSPEERRGLIHGLTAVTGRPDQP